MGLFVSHGSFFTQCEAEGFRRITYFLDRPDVMARYSVDAARRQGSAIPVLLSNGNLVEHGELTRASATSPIWDDPFPKPSYLFALVAGRLEVHEQRIRTRSRPRARCCRSTSSRATSTRPSTRWTA